MEIQINNLPVDFELNNEKTIGDVIESIVDWTKHRNLIFTETSINNNNYSIDKLPDIPLTEIKTLNCFVQSKADVVISSLNACIDYCAKFQEFFKKSIADGKIDIDEIENAASGIDWVVEVLGKISELLVVNLNEIKYKDYNVASYIEKIIEFKKYIINNKKNINKLTTFIDKEIEIFSIINNILKMLLMSENMKSLVIQSIDSPDVLLTTLVNIKKEIPVQIKSLEEIAISYQTRKDDIGAEKLEQFVNFIFNYCRTCFQVAPVFGINLDRIIVDGISLNEKNNEIQNHLDNVMDVMDNNDIISLSDILEYEMKTSLENLEIYIDTLIDFIEKNA
jgi:hypothetical protein